MAEKNHQPGENYRYPLIIKKLLATPLMDSPDREIVYSDRHRYTYKDFVKRIAMLANGLATLGLRPGETVAVFDYDSHRYLECFFAVPMMGSVLQTVNWRLSTDQIRYALNHAEAKMIIIHADFLPVLETIIDQLETVKTYVIITENGPRDTKRGFAAEYEALLQSAGSGSLRWIWKM
ncbi:MAG: AMP-binding protein [Syntrophaceae bacterium]|nr:AMP-binding protein [Syntrophaceae bacterium]